MFGFWIFLTILIVLATITGVVFARKDIARPSTRELDRTSLEYVDVPGKVLYAGNKGHARLVVLAGVVVWVLATLAMSWHIVPAGEVGVVYRFGQIVGQKEEGLAILPPWQSLKKQSIKVQKYRFQKTEGQGEEIIAFSAETQDVFFDVTINYSLSKDQVQNLFRTVGKNWFEVLVPARVQNFFKEETVKYKADEVAPNRETIRQAVLTRLREELKPYSINVNDLLIDQLDFSAQYKQAIEDKQSQKQAAQQAQAKVAQTQAEAEQKVAAAEGDASAVKIAASAQAQANQEIAASLTDALVQYTYIQKLGPGVRVIITDGKSPIIVNDTGSADAAAAAAGG